MAYPLVLVVDQHPNAREVYRTALAKLECELLFCDRGEDALDAIDGHGPSLVILDMHFRHMLGTEVLNRIKVHCPELPVFLCADCDCFCYDARTGLAEACFFKSSQLHLLHDEIRRRTRLHPGTPRSSWLPVI